MNSLYIKSGECILGFQENDGMMLQTIFNTSGISGNFVGTPCFALTAAGVTEGNYSGISKAYTKLPNDFKIKNINKTENDLEINFLNTELGLVITVNYKSVPKANGFIITTNIRNQSDKEIVITFLSNCFVSGIAGDGNLKWYDDNKIKVYYIRSTWEGEAQIRTDSLENLGLYRTSVHPCSGNVKFGSVGSWSTGKYIPVMLLEDKETEKIWFMETDISANWEHDVSCIGGWEKEQGSLSFLSSCINEKNGGYTKTLQPTEEFLGPRTFVGCCNGKLNEAVKSLSDYRRHIIHSNNIGTNLPKLFFNDYMNCLWADPTEEKLIPLIDKSAEIGMEGFCIDAGWYTEIGCSWFLLGDWNASINRFPTMGLKGIINYIKSKGMIPGLWLEIEMCSENAYLYKMPDNFFLMRNKKRVGGSDRIPLNFTNPEVREYLFGKIEVLVNMGVGFFKNDYNMCIGTGDDTFSSAGDGLYSNTIAFYDFIIELKKRHKGLLIENCGSGAMRQDYGILSLCDLQSGSDQEEYTLMPSIVTGQMLCVLPEQLGVWAYPNPLLFLNRNNPEILDSQEYKNEYKDGEETIFNMVTSLCGVPYLSGRIDKADKFNLDLIKEAISLFKKIRDFINSSYPYYTSKFLKIGSRAISSFALINKENTKMLFYIWRLDCDEKKATVPLPVFKGKSININQIYPTDPQFTEKISWNEISGEITFELSRRKTARLFEITL